jgi:ParB-like chromosome segregation protein Spo0J
LDTELVDIASLTADPANVRTHDDQNIEAITGSLNRFGQQKPIVVNQDGLVVPGNGTLDAARPLRWTTIAVVRTPLEGNEAMAYAKPYPARTWIAHGELQDASGCGSVVRQIQS